MTRTLTHTQNYHDSRISPPFRLAKSENKRKTMHYYSLITTCINTNTSRSGYTKIWRSRISPQYTRIAPEVGVRLPECVVHGGTACGACMYRKGGRTCKISPGSERTLEIERRKGNKNSATINRVTDTWKEEKFIECQMWSKRTGRRALLPQANVKICFPDRNAQHLFQGKMFSRAGFFRCC